MGIRIRRKKFFIMPELENMGLTLHQSGGLAIAITKINISFHKLSFLPQIYVFMENSVARPCYCLTALTPLESATRLSPTAFFLPQMTQIFAIALAGHSLAIALSR